MSVRTSRASYLPCVAPVADRVLRLVGGRAPTDEGGRGAAPWRRRARACPGIAAEGGAVGLEGARTGRAGSGSAGSPLLAGPFDRLPDAEGPLAGASDRLVVTAPRDHDCGIAQVEQPDLNARAAAENLLAEAGVNVHAARRGAGVFRTRGPAGLVVDRREAPSSSSSRRSMMPWSSVTRPSSVLSSSSRPTAFVPVGILDLEVALDERSGVRDEAPRAASSSSRLTSSAVGSQLAPGRVEALERRPRPCGPRAAGRQKRSSGPCARASPCTSVRRGRLGEPLDVGEPEGERAVGERGDLGRRQRGRQRERGRRCRHLAKATPPGSPRPA